MPSLTSPIAKTKTPPADRCNIKYDTTSALPGEVSHIVRISAPAVVMGSFATPNLPLQFCALLAVIKVVPSSTLPSGLIMTVPTKPGAVQTEVRNR